MDHMDVYENMASPIPMDLSSFSQVTNSYFFREIAHLQADPQIPVVQQIIYDIKDIPSDYKDIPCASLKTETKKKTPLFLVETFFVETIIFQPNQLAGSRIPQNPIPGIFMEIPSTKLMVPTIYIHFLSGFISLISIIII